MDIEDETKQIAAFPTLCLFCEDKECVFNTVKQRFLKNLNNLKAELNTYLPVLDYERYFWVKDPGAIARDSE